MDNKPYNPKLFCNFARVIPDTDAEKNEDQAARPIDQTTAAARVLFALAQRYHNRAGDTLAHVDSVSVFSSGNAIVSVTLPNDQPREYPAKVSKNMVIYAGRFAFYGLKDEDCITAIEPMNPNQANA